MQSKRLDWGFGVCGLFWNDKANEVPTAVKHKVCASAFIRTCVTHLKPSSRQAPAAFGTETLDLTLIHRTPPPPQKPRKDEPSWPRHDQWIFPRAAAAERGAANSVRPAGTLQTETFSSLADPNQVTLSPQPKPLHLLND